MSAPDNATLPDTLGILVEVFNAPLKTAPSVAFERRFWTIPAIVVERLAARNKVRHAHLTAGDGPHFTREQ